MFSIVWLLFGLVFSLFCLWVWLRFPCFVYWVSLCSLFVLFFIGFAIVLAGFSLCVFCEYILGGPPARLIFLFPATFGMLYRPLDSLSSFRDVVLTFGRFV